MKNWVQFFAATERFPKLADVVPCARCMCHWIVEGAAANDAQSIHGQPKLPIASMSVGDACDAGEVVGMSALVGRARIPVAKAAVLEAEIRAQGAVHVQELTVEDWKGLSAWSTLLCFEQRRLLSNLQL